MNDKLIQTLWNEGKGKEPKMSKQEIEGILHKSVKRGWTDLRRMVWFYLAMMAAILVVSGMNIAVYASNPTWLGVHLGLTLLTVGFLAFGTHLLTEMRRLDDPAQELTELVRRKLRFFRTKYQAWLGVVALAIWILGFAVSLYMYNQDGHYRIKKDLFILCFAVAQLIMIYVIVRIAHYPLAQRMLAALRDVEAQATEATQRFERSQKYRVLIAILTFLLGLALFVGLLAHFLVGKGL
jgi:hypothetical protein